MEREDYILDENVYRSLMALRDFAENAFCGYGEEHGHEEEMELADTFSLLVRDYINLIDASKETVEEYIEHRPYLQKLIKNNI